jgi:hypothetical protein
VIFTQKCKEFIPDFIKCCCEGSNRIPYVEKGILNIEAFYWWSLIAFFEPDIILESGVSKGRSTEIIARAQKYYNIPKHYAFDIDNRHERFVRQKLRPYQTVYSIMDSTEGFNGVLSKDSGTTVIIMDGPKSSLGIKSVFRMLHKFSDRILAVGCHDCEPNSKVRNAFAINAKKFIINNELIFTEIDHNFDFLNNYIKEDIAKSKKLCELFEKSYFVGISYQKVPKGIK